MATRQIDVNKIVLGRWTKYERRIEYQLELLSILSWLDSAVEVLERISSMSIVWAMRYHRSVGNEAFIPVVPLHRFTRDQLDEYLNLIPFKNRETTIKVDPAQFAATTLDDSRPYYLLDVNPERNFFTRPSSGRLQDGRRHLTASEIVALAIHVQGVKPAGRSGFWAGAAGTPVGRGGRDGSSSYPYVACEGNKVGGLISCGTAVPTAEDMYWPTCSLVAVSDA